MNPAKLHPSLAAAVGAKGVAEGPLSLIVRLRPGAVARGEVGVQAGVPGAVDFTLLSARAMTVSADMLAALTEDPSVEMIWPDLPVHTWLQRAVPLLSAPRVWDTGFTGRGVRVAVLDTGIDPEHPDFEGRVAAWRDFVEADGAAAAEPRDPNGHGTHVAGIAAGSGAASNGRFRGVAPDAQLLVGRVLDERGFGMTSTVMLGVEWAVAECARVINVSLGGPPYPSDGTDAFSALCNAAVDHGAVVCVAAGNLGPNGHTIGSPAAAARVITVGACAGSSEPTAERVAPFSSRGPTGDGRTKPDLVMPGVGIVSARARGTSLGTTVDDRYTAVSGTSQATPMATGTAALLLQANPRLAPAEIRSRLRRGARALVGAEPSEQGAGRGDAYNTFVSAVGEPLVAREPVPDDPGDPARPEPDRPEDRPGCLPGGALAGGLRRDAGP